MSFKILTLFSQMHILTQVEPAYSKCRGTDGKDTESTMLVILGQNCSSFELPMSLNSPTALALFSYLALHGFRRVQTSIQF